MTAQIVPTTTEGQPFPVVVLISGRGSNMQAIAQQAQATPVPFILKAVISDRPHAPGLSIAQGLALPTRALSPRDFADREAFDAALADLVESFQPALVVLAGYMRILSKTFVQRFEGRLLNVHPSLLPRHRGLHTHQRVLEAGEREHGVSVHFVTEELDSGPVIIQAVIDVNPGDTVESLSARIQRQEHRIYPQAVQWFASGRLQWHDRLPWLDGKPLHEPVIVDARSSSN